VTKPRGGVARLPGRGAGVVSRVHLRPASDGQVYVIGQEGINLLKPERAGEDLKTAIRIQCYDASYRAGNDFMKEIKLDASKWKTTEDFYDAVLIALGAPGWHGRNLNALIDSISSDEINDVRLPYCFLLVGTENLPSDLSQAQGADTPHRLEQRHISPSGRSTVNYRHRVRAEPLQPGFSP